MLGCQLLCAAPCEHAQTRGRERLDADAAGGLQPRPARNQSFHPQLPAPTHRQLQDIATAQWPAAAAAAPNARTSAVLPRQHLPGHQARAARPAHEQRISKVARRGERGGAVGVDRPHHLCQLVPARQPAAAGRRAAAAADRGQQRAARGVGRAGQAQHRRAAGLVRGAGGRAPARAWRGAWAGAGAGSAQGESSKAMVWGVGVGHQRRWVWQPSSPGRHATQRHP
jgi:hypothetical protein